jgi:uncharacterized protein DUF1569
MGTGLSPLRRSHENTRQSTRQARHSAAGGPAPARSQGALGTHVPSPVLCHLNDSFLAVMGEKYVSPANGPLQRTVVKWIALYAPIRWPKGVPTRPEMDQFAGGSTPSEFDCDKRGLVTLIERFSNPKRDFEWSAHPIFGRMPDPEWLRWGYLHSDHHLRQFGQ